MKNSTSILMIIINVLATVLFLKTFKYFVIEMLKAVIGHSNDHERIRRESQELKEESKNEER